MSKGSLFGSIPTSLVRVDPIKAFKTVTFDSTLSVASEVDTPCMQYPVQVDYPNTQPEPDPDPDPDLWSNSYLTIPDLSNVLITYKVLINGIEATALIDSGAQEDFVDTNFVLAYNMATTSSSHKRYVSLANGTRQDASATLTNATMVMTPIPGEGSHLFEDTINPTVTALGRYDLILGKPWLTRVNPTPDWTLNTLKIHLPNGKQGIFQGIVKTPTQEAHIAHLDVDTFKQAVNEGVDHFYGFLRPDHSQNMALYGLTAQSIQLSDPLPSQTLPSWTNREPTHHIVDTLPVQPPTMETNDERNVRFDKAFKELKLPACTTQEDRQKILDAILEHKDVLRGMPTAYIPPLRPGVDHRIPFTNPDAPPPFFSTYRLSVLELDECKKQLADLLARGFIEPSESPFGAPILFVRKKGGALRFCVDYRALNKITIKNRYAIPRAEELFDRLQGASIFSKIDLESGYWQIRVADEDVHKTAFRTRYGHYQFKVMPFGLTNAPATFQSAMNNMFNRYLDEFVVIFLDDILIFSKDPTKHAQHLTIVLQTLRKNGYFARLHKCSFGEKTVEFLGHVISYNTISMDKEKLQGVQDWPTPTTIKQVRGLLGLAGYYRRLIQDFATMAAPLHKLPHHDNTIAN